MKKMIKVFAVAISSTFAVFAGGSDMKDFGSVQIGYAASSLHAKDYGIKYDNHGRGFDFRAMCSIVNAVAEKREGIFVSDWWGTEVGFGRLDSLHSNKWLDIRFEFSPKLGYMISDDADIYFRTGWLTGNNWVGLDAYDAIFLSAGTNLPFGRLEAGFGKNGTVSTKFHYYMVDCAVHIGHFGYWGVRYEAFPYKEEKATKVRNFRAYFSIFS